MKRFTATQARKMWFQLIQLAGKPGSIITIAHRDQPDVVMMSLDEWESWQETVEVLSDPELMEAIREHEESDDEENVTWEELKEELNL